MYFFASADNESEGSCVVNSVLKRCGENKSTIMKCGFVC